MDPQSPRSINPLDGQLQTILTGTVSALLSGIETAVGLKAGTVQFVMPAVEDFARRMFGTKEK